MPLSVLKRLQRFVEISIPQLRSIYSGVTLYINNLNMVISPQVMKYLEKTQIMVNLGGIPTTLEHSGEQWDYPNAWPPLQYIMIIGENSVQIINLLKLTIESRNQFFFFFFFFCVFKYPWCLLRVIMGELLNPPTLEEEKCSRVDFGDSLSPHALGIKATVNVDVSNSAYCITQG